MTAAIAEVASAEEARDAVMDARRDAAPMEIRGGGSVLDRLRAGDAPVLSVAGMTGVVAHAAEDLTVTVRAGTPLAELAQVLADAGQECPIEAAGGAGSTVGGRIATALAGPRQLGAGRVRDWLLRVRFVTGAGHLATAGGVTVKDVTGYDLCRLMTGSWGTLGVITEVTLKLRPLARHRAWYAADRRRHDLDALLYRPVSAITTRERTHVLLEGHPDDASEQAALAGVEPAEAPTLPTAARASVDPAQLIDLVTDLDALGLTWAAQDGVGVCHLDGEAEQLTAARATAEGRGGALLVLDPTAGVTAFGGMRSSAITDRVVAALDPDHVLAPWRWTR
jgi:glycolate oxidase FAD binding subunit